jgi:TPR repeat protein
VTYATGSGVGQDYGVAREWLRKAAEQGHAEARVRLAEMYALGLGVSRDTVEAYALIESAMPGLAAEGQFSKAAARQMQDAIAAGLSAEQLADARDRARRWQAAAEQ